MNSLMLWLLLPPAALNQLGADAFTRGHYPAAQRLFEMAWHQQPDARIASNLAATARRQLDWPTADRWFTQVIELRTATLGASHADTAMAWNNRGETRLQAGRLAEARADLDHARALAHSPADLAVVLHNQGDLAFRAGQWEAARSDLERSLTLRPASPATAHLLARVLAALGEAALDRARLREAIRLCRESATLAPTLQPAVRCRERINALAVEAQP